MASVLQLLALSDAFSPKLYRFGVAKTDNRCWTNEATFGPTNLLSWQLAMLLRVHWRRTWPLCHSEVLAVEKETAAAVEGEGTLLYKLLCAGPVASLKKQAPARKPGATFIQLGTTVLMTA